MNRLNRIYDNFTEITNNEIGNYFNIDNDYKFELIRLDQRTYHFISKYDKKMKLNLDLPFELNEYIKTFVYKKSYIKYELFYPLDYPFKGPIWKLIETDDNNIKYTIIANLQNYLYQKCWSPSILMDKDILYMIEHLVK